MTARELAGRFARACFASLALVLLAGGIGYAQVDTGGILGTVKDQSGAVIPNAKVTLTNEGTNLSADTTTGADGTYVFTPVRIGTYSVAAEVTGFQKVTRPHITLNVQQQVVVDFDLVPGMVTQTVEVTAAVPLLQTTNASVGQVVNSRAVNDLPLNGRNFTFLAQLTAGVTVGQPDNRGLMNSGSFTANGTRPAQNNYLLDGVDNNIDVVDFLNGTAFVVLPPVDAIQEFKVQTNSYSAEIGRAGGAVLNATIKSGTNKLHGTAWEFLRNDKLDAADFFENALNKKIGEYRQNQFGGSIGGPVVIPNVYDGKNKTFWFADFEGLRVRQAQVFSPSVPTVAERSSGYTDFSDLLEQGAGGSTRTDLLGRTFPLGQIYDPATTRAVTAGQVDPVTGLTATAAGYVRDPFVGNLIPAGRLNQNAIKLLNLYPTPTSSSLFSNYASGPLRKEKRNTFDVRVDHNFSERDQIFARVSYFDDPQFIPGPFAGIADGGAFNQGDQIATSRNAVLSYTHSFTPSMINEARIGFSGIHTGRLQPNGNTMGLPEQYGIQGIPQIPLNGGLPAFGIGGLSTIGSNAFLVSDEFNSTLQVTENLTKIYKSHSFKGGFEFQHIKFSTLQPPWSRGQFNFDGPYTEMPNNTGGNTGRAQLLLTPIDATVPNGVDLVGGANTVFASNMANTDNGHNYYGAYFQDDWKATPKLTVNLGVRWDHFGYVEENFGGQANFVPGVPGSAQYLIPVERKSDPLSPSFIDLLAKDGIDLVYSNNFALGVAQKTNFSPRVGFAYQATPKLVVRGGYGIFYGGFENRGYSPNIGENYPFQFGFSFFRPDDAHSITYTNPDGSFCDTARLETGFTCLPLDPKTVNASGLTLRGIQYNYITPYTQGYNFTVQYQLTPNQALEVGYVASLARHLEVFPGSNRESVLLPPGTDITNYQPFPDFARGASYAATEGSSYYHSLQAKFERRFSNGFNFLTAYTWAKARSDAHDLLNGGGDQGYRGVDVPGVGIQYDYGLANFDIRHAFKFSGGYELPFGRGKPYAKDISGVANQFVGGWSLNWILTLQNGQPITIPCAGASTRSASDASCYALLVGDPTSGKHNVDQWMNPAAFTAPGPVTTVGQTDLTPLGGDPSQVIGPGFHRFDLSIFKDFRTSENTKFQFRAEFFNLTNTPNFMNPGFGGNGLVAIPGSTDYTSPNFGKVGSTRDVPNDPRQIQFALKFIF